MSFVNAVFDLLFIYRTVVEKELIIIWFLFILINVTVIFVMDLLKDSIILEVKHVSEHVASLFVLHQSLVASRDLYNGAVELCYQTASSLISFIEITLCIVVSLSYVLCLAALIVWLELINVLSVEVVYKPGFFSPFNGFVHNRLYMLGFVDCFGVHYLCHLETLGHFDRPVHFFLHQLRDRMFKLKLEVL